MDSTTASFVRDRTRCACTPDCFCTACIRKVESLMERGYFWNMRLDLIETKTPTATGLKTQSGD
jgi:hypothetical protein